MLLATVELVSEPSTEAHLAWIATMTTREPLQFLCTRATKQMVHEEQGESENWKGR